MIPAAGASSRFGGTIPKPYLRIAGRSLLEHALRAMLGCKAIAGGVVVTAAGDRRWIRLPASMRRRVVTTTGGSSRARSVLNGLRALEHATPEDWVLVHDAARPGLPPADLAALILACRRDVVGGLLAVPIAETLKQSDGDCRSSRSVARDGLWRAQTPQMFHHGQLTRALTRALSEGFEPSDEAAAIESLGLRPKLVEGSPLNIKVTRPADLALARAAVRMLKGVR
ncbi:MAG TPA: 2-C-methyl-D-erythritol 4-phosphate cytidylyltransferase [Steroidobacteraceae bacterium]|nr:2-C-methyl-D-erythritol 4-phosphate cytidylyltransferase [Steroidobacteraceae bacterium]